MPNMIKIGKYYINAEQLMSDTPGLGSLDAHFEAVGMLDGLLAYAAQWAADAAAERAAQ